LFGDGEMPWNKKPYLVRRAYIIYRCDGTDTRGNPILTLSEEEILEGFKECTDPSSEVFLKAFIWCLENKISKYHMWVWIERDLIKKGYENIEEMKEKLARLEAKEKALSEELKRLKGDWNGEND
jgi:hypothetical protein